MNSHGIKDAYTDTAPLLVRKRLVFSKLNSQSILCDVLVKPTIGHIFNQTLDRPSGMRLIKDSTDNASGNIAWAFETIEKNTHGYYYLVLLYSTFNNSIFLVHLNPLYFVNNLALRPSQIFIIFVCGDCVEAKRFLNKLNNHNIVWISYPT